MRRFLSQSISSINRNKLNGLLAEVDFRSHVTACGFGDRVSVGGWLARNVGADVFGESTIALFPEILQPDRVTDELPTPHQGLHAVCSGLHSIGIRSYYCAPVVHRVDEPASIGWHTKLLGVPTAQDWKDFPGDATNGFSPRTKRYNFLRYTTDVAEVPDAVVPEEFTKEHLRVTFQNAVMQETSDIDGLLWGQQYTYPIEIKEKTPATDNKLGQYFGLDVGPFVKLAFYAARRGNLRSLFVVKEIDDPEHRNLVDWWYITFDELARWASWVSQGGGRTMGGGASTVVKIPKSRFQRLDAVRLGTL